MTYVVVTKAVSAMPIAAVRRQVRRNDIAHAWKPALDEVWAFLRERPELKPHGNIFLYHHPPRRDDPMDIDCGVGVAQSFRSQGAIVSTATPAGVVASVVHRGAYDGLGAAHDAIHAWRAANNRSFAACSWEIYGDWNEDQAKLETEINYLLRP